VNTKAQSESDLCDTFIRPVIEPAVFKTPRGADGQAAIWSLRSLLG
jgi:hypothetical protein